MSDWVIRKGENGLMLYRDGAVPPVGPFWIAKSPALAAEIISRMEKADRKARLLTSADYEKETI
jgi:hypothetical protein